MSTPSRNPRRLPFNLEALEGRIPIAESVGPIVALSSLAALAELAHAAQGRTADSFSSAGPATRLLTPSSEPAPRSLVAEAPDGTQGQGPLRFLQLTSTSESDHFRSDTWCRDPFAVDIPFLKSGDSPKATVRRADADDGSLGLLPAGGMDRAAASTVIIPERDSTVPLMTIHSNPDVADSELLTLAALTLPQLAGPLATNPITLTPSVNRNGLGKAPAAFEANLGQIDPQVRFLARAPGYTLFLTATEAAMVFPSVAEADGARGTGANVVRMQFVGANVAPAVVGQYELPGKSNYFRGNDPAKWVTNVPQYARVAHQDVYPGVDLVYYGNGQRQIEHDWVVAPGADPRVISVAYQGAEGLRLDAAGNLLLRIAGGEVTQHAPVIYQEVNGTRRTIPGRYVVQSARHIGFELAAYDTARPLVIDPVLSYSTYLGGSGQDDAFGVAMDADGNAYVTGRTGSLNFPPGTNPPYQPSFGGGAFDAFVTKLAPDGSTPIYSTYRGGSLTDIGRGIAVNASGVAYVTGNTQSLNFPTTAGAFQRTRNGPFNAFVTALDATGSGLVYSTYLGGNGFDRGNAIAIDVSGTAYLTGTTSSTNFPPGVFPPARPFLSGSADAFVAVFDASGASLLYSTYLGGNLQEDGNGIGFDPNGYVYVTGSTPSSDFPVTPGAYQTTYGGTGDAFLTKLLPIGTPLDYSTFLGGSGNDIGTGIALDSFGVAWIAGQTASSANFPTSPNGRQRTYGGGPLDAFVTGLNSLLPGPDGLFYSTYLGGSQEDLANGIGLDMFATVYVTGRTSSSADFPIVNPVQEVTVKWFIKPDVTMVYDRSRRPAA